MISLIYGPKGTGKTKIILEKVNESVKNAKGNVVFLAKSGGYSVAIDFAVKCVFADEYGINNVEQLRGFIKGMLAVNNDIEYLFIDGIARIAECNLVDLKPVFEDLEKADKNVKIVLTISSDFVSMPDFIKKFAN
ncbi:MAG TPA: hypothetical protein DDY82_00825 [Clostridiales bacterium]|nr:hypothetical protein [Clostridiales bacterium]